MLLRLLIRVVPQSGNEPRVVRQSKSPDPNQEEEYRRHGLLVAGNEDSPLQFDVNWSALAIDQWLREKFVQPFKYLDARYGVRDGSDETFHYSLVRTYYNKQTLIERVALTGHDLDQAKGTNGRARSTHTVRVGECFALARRITLTRIMLVSFPPSYSS